MKHSNLEEILAALPESAGAVLFRIATDISVKSKLSLPTEKHIGNLPINCHNYK